MDNYIYTIGVDVSFCIEHNICFEQASLMQVFQKASGRASHIIYNGEVYYRLNLSKIRAELPMLTQKDDTIYRYIKDLIDKGIIKKIPKVDYYKLTELGSEYNTKLPIGNKSDVSEINPTPIGNKSDSQSDLNPTYNNTNNNNIHNKEKTEKRLTIQKYIETWNQIPAFGYAKKGLPKVMKVTDELKKVRGDILKNFTDDEIISGTTNYINYMSKLKPSGAGNTYHEHRFAMLAFLKQKNGLSNFINIS